MANSSDAISTPNPGAVVADSPLPLAKRPSWKVLALALVVAGVSDVLSFSVALVPPLQWMIDIVTALALFLILGRRLAILPGLIAEAIPGMGVFPVWILVVISIILMMTSKAANTRPRTTPSGRFLRQQILSVLN